MRVKPEFSLQIVSQQFKKRSVHFASQKALDFWHEEILRQQGFWGDGMN